PEESAPPFSVQGAEQSVPSSTDWSAPLNISVTDSDSRKPSIAADSNGGVHIVWVERKIGEPEEIYYKYWNGTAWSTPINVSNSSGFYSNDPQVAADSSGRVYITWQEQDDGYTGDAEILYSQCAEGVCTAPVSLSGPPNWDCGRYYPNLQDWHSQVPILGIDQAGRLMVEWRAYEPGELTMPYTTWLNTGTPPSIRTGCVPSGAGVYNRSVGSSRIAGGLAGDFRLLFEEGRSDGTAGIYYSRYSSAHWTSSYLAQGHWPDVFLDTSNQAHGTWCGTDGKLRYWNSATFITETILDVTCNWYSPIAIDASGLPRVFWNQAGHIYESKRLPEGWSEGVDVSRGTGGAAWPDVVVDGNGDLHLAWYELSDGNFEIYYANTIATRVPVILLPGGTGSRLYSPQSFSWSQPDGHGGTYTNTYKADDEIWINLSAMVNPQDPGDDYFDVARLEKDGVTQSTAANYGVNLEAREILDKVSGIDIYNNLLTDLQNAGYQPGVDLFVFPYDWRMDIATNAALLDSKVQEALEKANGTKDTSQWTIKQIDLLTHSMGASVARQYISDPARAARVNRLIAIGPAFLGAPKFTKLVLFGDPLLPCVYHENLCLLDPAEVKDIAQNMPGLFEVAPGRAYWTFYDGSGDNLQVFQEDWDFDGDGQVLGALSYDQFKSMLFGLDRDPDLDWDGAGKDINQTVFNMGEAFHDQLDFSWDSSIPVPDIDIIAGTGKCTIGQIQAGYRISFKPPIGGPVQIGPIVRLKYVNGDNTVPLFSATLYDPARGIDHRGGANVYYVARKFTDHAFLPSKDPVRQLVLNLLAGDNNVPDGIISEADVPKRCQGTIINVESPVELHVTDAADNHTGWATLPDVGGPVIEQAIPGSEYDEIEETKSVYLPDDGAYTISLKATDSGSFNLILDLYKSDGTVGSIVFLRAPLTTTTTGEMTYDTSSTEPPLLYLDHNEDGIYDETITATSVLGQTESTDTQPPQIQITSPLQGQVLAGGGLMAWQTGDDNSGVLNEWGYIDMDTPNALQVTNGEVMTLPPGSHTLTVLAEDRLGNASQEQVSFTVYPFEWLFPLGGTGTYSAKAGSAIPVKFSVSDLDGMFVHDESVELSLLDASGNIAVGPIIFAHNPNQGVAIQGHGQYHHNLKTKGLAAGTYTLRVVFNSSQLSGVVELDTILR
ncbi:MAG: PxKF domain-containing protein, partial [Chloroflexi bacterium]|nr:PxKF domain-containing protein [Chloroflexota bacterium]